MKKPKQLNKARLDKKKQALTEFEQFAQFLALPREERREIYEYHTESDFAKKHKISRATLWNWKQDGRFWTLRDKYLVVFKKYTADILAGLRRRAIKEGRGQDAIAWMKLVEKYREKMDITSDDEKIGGFIYVKPKQKKIPKDSPDNKAGPSMGDTQG